MAIFAELKRRNVFRAGALYLVVSWLILQIADVLFGVLQLPDWTLTFVAALLALGLLPALIFSWAYEITPEGIKRESEIPAEESITAHTGQKLDRLTIALLVITIGVVAADRLMPGGEEQTQTGQSVAEARTDAPSVADSGDAAASEAETTETKSDSALASVAVLPFVNMSADADNEFFSDGISEELLNLLVKVEGLRVPSRTSSFQFKGQNMGVSEVGRTLRVEHVLEGSVRKAGNRVRITAQLIDVDSDSHLWSETYDRDLTDIFAVQDEIAAAIIEALKQTLGVSELDFEARNSQETQVPEAYEAFLRGRDIWVDRGANVDLWEGVEALKRAVELDPGYARAWGTLAALYASIPPYVNLASDAFDVETTEAARHALAIDPDQPEANAALGLTYVNLFGWAQAEAALERAARASPHNSTPWLWKLTLHAQSGQAEAALEAAAKGLSIDPDMGVLHSWNAIALYQRGRVKEAMAAAREATNRGHSLGAVLLLPAAMAEGEEAFREAWARIPFGPDVTDLADDYLAARNDPTRVDDLFARLPPLTNGISAILAAGLGDFDRAFVRLQTLALDERHSHVLGFLFSPLFDGSRSHPGFTKIIESVKLEAFWREKGFPPMCRPLEDGGFECD